MRLSIIIVDLRSKVQLKNSVHYHRRKKTAPFNVVLNSGAILFMWHGAFSLLYVPNVNKFCQILDKFTDFGYFMNGMRLICPKGQAGGTHWLLVTYTHVYVCRVSSTWIKQLRVLGYLYNTNCVNTIKVLRLELCKCSLWLCSLVITPIILIAQCTYYKYFSFL